MEDPGFPRGGGANPPGGGGYKNMSHFAYACKMRYPLNLVLENIEYLWFY